MTLYKFGLYVNHNQVLNTCGSTVRTESDDVDKQLESIRCNPKVDLSVQLYMDRSLPLPLI